jgi:hypothetical protein
VFPRGTSFAARSNLTGFVGGRIVGQEQQTRFHPANDRSEPPGKGQGGGHRGVKNGVRIVPEKRGRPDETLARPAAPERSIGTAQGVLPAWARSQNRQTASHVSRRILTKPNDRPARTQTDPGAHDVGSGAFPILTPIHLVIVKV